MNSSDRPDPSLIVKSSPQTDTNSISKATGVNMLPGEVNHSIDRNPTQQSINDKTVHFHEMVKKNASEIMAKAPRTPSVDPDFVKVPLDKKAFWAVFLGYNMINS